MRGDSETTPVDGKSGGPSRGRRVARKIAVGAAGAAVLAVGVVLVFTPGPAFLVIPAGLAILATEFPWAGRLLRVSRDRARRLFARRTPVGREG